MQRGDNGFQLFGREPVLQHTVIAREFHHAGAAQLGQMVGHSRLVDAHGFHQIGHVFLALQQQAQNHQPVRMRNQLQQRRGFFGVFQHVLHGEGGMGVHKKHCRFLRRKRQLLFMI